VSDEKGPRMNSWADLQSGSQRKDLSEDQTQLGTILQLRSHRVTAIKTVETPRKINTRWWQSRNSWRVHTVHVGQRALGWVMENVSQMTDQRSDLHVDREVRPLSLISHSDFCSPLKRASNWPWIYFPCLLYSTLFVLFFIRHYVQFFYGFTNQLRFEVWLRWDKEAGVSIRWRQMETDFYPRQYISVVNFNSWESRCFSK